LGGHTLLDQFTTTYLKYRWFIGGGIVSVTATLMLLGAARPYLWIVTVAGLFILAHALASGVWSVKDAVSALVVDITVGNIALFVFGNANHDSNGAELGLIVLSVLVVLLADGWQRIVLLGYAFAFAVATMLAAAAWELTAVVGKVVGLVFIVGVLTGVVSSIRRRMSELEAARAQTVGVVSHELRNNLAGVIGVTELLSDPHTQLDPEEMRELLQLAHQQAVEAGDVIEDLLTASRAERGVLDVAIEVVDLCREAEVVMRRVGGDDREIPLECPDGPVWVMADPHRFRQVLRNLITNAVRYGGPDVRVSIVSVGPIGSVVVTDDGDGVHPADETAIFLPYRRSRNQTPAPGSTGLGLWIARNLTRQMGGDLTYQRRSGQTIFEVTLTGAHPRATTSPDVAARSSPRD
jgi:signal transduction histidine kinase